MAIFLAARCARQSVRGIRVCDAISRHCDLHLFNRQSVGRSTIRLKFTGAELGSNRVRTPEEGQVLRQLGGGIKVYQFQGNLTFTTTEAIVNTVLEEGAEASHLISDFNRVLTINESACRLLYLLLGKFAECERPVLFTHVSRLSLLRRYLKLKLGARFEELFHSFEENDLALEWCEDQVLKHALPKGVPSARASPKDYELLAGLSAVELGTVRKLLVRPELSPWRSDHQRGRQGRGDFLSRARRSQRVHVARRGIAQASGHVFRRDGLRRNGRH